MLPPRLRKIVEEVRPTFVVRRAGGVMFAAASIAYLLSILRFYALDHAEMLEKAVVFWIPWIFGSFVWIAAVFAKRPSLWHVWNVSDDNPLAGLLVAVLMAALTLVVPAFLLQCAVWFSEWLGFSVSVSADNVWFSALTFLYAYAVHSWLWFADFSKVDTD